MTVLVTLLNFIFDAYIFILLVRLLLQKLGASWGNPISQLVVKLTEPVVKPLRKIVPGFKGFDLAIVLAMLVIQFIGTMILLAIKVHITPGIVGNFVISVGHLGNKLVNVYFWGVIFSVIMSWLPTLAHNPLGGVVNTIVAPLLNLGRRWVPIIAGMDLSPIPILLFLWIIKALVFRSVIVYGFHLAYSSF